MESENKDINSASHHTKKHMRCSILGENDKRGIDSIAKTKFLDTD